MNEEIKCSLFACFSLIRKNQNIISVPRKKNTFRLLLSSSKLQYFIEYNSAPYQLLTQWKSILLK